MNFLGTTDSQPLVLRTTNVQSLRIEPSAETFNGLPITANVIAGSSANSVSSGVRGGTISGGGLPSGDSDPVFVGEAPNRVTDAYGTVGGGFGNTAGDGAGATTDSSSATVGGGLGNTASGSISTVSGGLNNAASGFASTVAGGQTNTAAAGASVGGGTANAATAIQSVVAGGLQNAAGGSQSSIGGGAYNFASGNASTVGGGKSNTASGHQSVVGGGFQNVASGERSSVPGGLSNCAGAASSWAGGRDAKVQPANDPGGNSACSGLSYPGGNGDAGTFVWADAQEFNFVSSGPDQFLVRATGGMALNGRPSTARWNSMSWRTATVRITLTCSCVSAASKPGCWSRRAMPAARPPTTPRSTSINTTAARRCAG